MKFFSKFLKTDDSVFNFYLRINILKYLPELANWLELHIPLLVNIENEVSCLNSSSSRFIWKQLSSVVENKQLDRFFESGLTFRPYKNYDFANELIMVVHFFIWDVDLVLSEMSEYQTKLDKN